MALILIAEQLRTAQRRYVKMLRQGGSESPPPPPYRRIPVTTSDKVVDAGHWAFRDGAAIWRPGADPLLGAT